ncbi:hypothetical protein Tco_0884168, partial [Tanacetum coccineum]
LVNTAHPKTTVYSAKSKTHFSKQSQSTAKRPFYKQTTSTRRSLHKAKRHYYTRRYNAVNTAKSYTGQVNAVKVKRVNAVKSSTYWVWRPTKSNGNPQHDDTGFVDSGCSRHMTGNIAYLSDFKQFDGGYVAFGGENYYCQANVNAVKRTWAPKLQLFPIRISKEVGTPRYLSLVVPLTKVGNEAVHKELGDRMERAATTTSS